MYPVEIVRDDRNGQFKAHYVGYSSQYDERRNNSDIVPLDQNTDEHTSQEAMDSEPETNVDVVFVPFSLYSELSVKVKCALSNRRKENPSIRIDIPFDKMLFDGGFKVYGTPSRVYRGTQRYKITNFKDSPGPKLAL